MNTQTQLLKQLMAKAPYYLTQQQLEQATNCSAGEISKQINALTALGHSIEQQPAQGYRYRGDRLLATSIYQILKPQFRGLKLHLFDQVTSTNQVAKQAAKPTDNQVQVFIANRQTAGYGRYQRHFISPSQTGIYLSILLPLQQPLTAIGCLTTAVATAVFRAIQQTTGITTAIKWVNDLYYHQKKVCGILAETVTDAATQKITHLVIGIGVNFVNSATVPAHLTNKVGALFNQAPVLTRNQLIGAILNQFLLLYPTYQTGEFLTEYRQHSLLIKRMVTLKLGEQNITGTVKTINDAGELVLATNEGLKSFNSGEVTKVYF